MLIQVCKMSISYHQGHLYVLFKITLIYFTLNMQATHNALSCHTHTLTNTPTYTQTHIHHTKIHSHTHTLIHTLTQNLGVLETKARAVLAVYSKIMDKTAQGREGEEDNEHTTWEAHARPRSGDSSASIGSRIMCTPPTTTGPRPGSSKPGTIKGVGNKPSPVAADDKSGEDSDSSGGSPVVPLSREQLQAQIYART